MPQSESRNRDGSVLAVRLLLAVAAACFAGPAHAGGHTIESFPLVGIRFPRPNRFGQIPVPPSSKHLVLKFVEEAPPDREGIVVGRDQMLFLSFSEEDGPTEMTRFRALGAWVEQRFEGVTIGLDIEMARTRAGRTMHALPLILSAGSRKAVVGRVFVFPDDGRTLAAIGLGLGEKASENDDDWAFALRDLRFTERASLDLESAIADYRKRGLSQPEYRSRVRSSLLKGWKHRDSENFIIVYDTGNTTLLRAIERELEILRSEFERIFPPSSDLGRVSTVRICHDMADYLAYGGPPGSGGFWSPQLRELVLFDNARRDGIRDWTNADTRGVLYHEAFHQYVHDAVGEFEPAMWFNEGVGDLFSGARIQKGEVAGYGVESERLVYMKRLLGSSPDAYVPWQDFLRFEKETFYDPVLIEGCYAQAWSIVYFLTTAPEVRANEEWSSILPSYFESLKKGYVVAYAEGAESEGDEPERREKAERAARTVAHRLIFDRLDLDELEKAWKRFVLSL